MKTYYILLLVFLSNCAYAADIQYDQQKAMREEIFNEADLNTRACMHQAVEYYLLKGVRDQQEIIDDMLASCGGQVKALWANFQYPHPELITPYLESLAKDELRSVPGIQLSTSKQTK